jgi:hypothetical protein
VARAPGAGGESPAGALADRGGVFTCDVVIGELSQGSGIPVPVEASLRSLPRLVSPTSAETLDFITKHRKRLIATGIAWADAQVLLCAASSGTRLASADKPMQSAWRKLGFRAT